MIRIVDAVSLLIATFYAIYLTIKQNPYFRRKDTYLTNNSTFVESCVECPKPYTLLVFGFFMELILQYKFWLDLAKPEHDNNQKNLTIYNITKNELRFSWKLFSICRFLIGLINDVLDILNVDSFDKHSNWNKYQCTMYL